MKYGLGVRMLEIMLCGAHDVGDLAQMFSEVASDFGATPWWYNDGRIYHTNSRTSSWEENSRATVKRVDVCVFVILNRYGDITWNTELEQALESGKPFVVLALDSAWNRYATLLRTITDPASIRSEDDQKMIDVLRSMGEYNFTPVTFSLGAFKEKLRFALSMQFEHGINLLQTHNQRKALLQSLTKKDKLSQRQIDQLISLASDDYHENKYERKTAIRRLAADEVRNGDFVLEVCKSFEQGVQRLAFDLLPSLVPLPIEDSALRELAQIAAGIDDVGVARRLTLAVAKLQPSKLDILLEGMGSLEEGIRRRAYEGVDRHYAQVLGEWGSARMKRFLELCEAKSTVTISWLERLRRQLKDLL